MSERTYYVTTPIYYISGQPHIGHAYTTVVADVLARTARTSGPSFFLTGTDEHGQKVAEAAEHAGMSPQTWCDALVPRWQQLFASYDCAYDDFIRTTQPRHERVVSAVFERLRANGDVYRGTYEGWYCVSDETFWLESKLVDGNCPTCGRPVTRLTEESWFFRLSAYRQRLLEHFQANPQWVRPRSAYNEMLAILEGGLEDLSISRTAFDWGIPIADGSGVIYVWFDALLNYISAIGWSSDDAAFHARWPADVQLVGKEIARFHTIVWPAVLMALGLELPRLVYAHGWITVDGQKIGKSLGNAVDAFVLADRYGADTIRYFLLREAPFGSDFSYSEEKIIARRNADLGNDLGNLLNRSISMVTKYFSGVVPVSTATTFSDTFATLPPRYTDAVLDLRFRDALEDAWTLVSGLNRSIDEHKPWALAKATDDPEAQARLATLMYDLIAGLRWLAIMLAPIMPDRAREMWRQLGFSDDIAAQSIRDLRWHDLASGHHVGTGAPLFPRLELTP